MEAALLYLMEYYKNEKPTIIAPIMVAKKFQDIDLVKEHLTNIFEIKAHIKVPLKGNKKHLIELAILNANELLKNDKIGNNTKILNEIKELTKDVVILYVEDEAANRQVIIEMLNLLFKEVVIAMDGAEGLEKLNTHSIDIIITHMQKPKMNGLDMLEQSKKLYPDIPVIITTAFSDQN